MFVTTFLRSMPEGAKARRGYERLIGSGSVPGETTSFSAERGAKERVRSWREAAAVMDLGMASVLRVSEVVEAMHACRWGLLVFWGPGLALVVGYTDVGAVVGFPSSFLTFGLVRLENMQRGR